MSTKDKLRGWMAFLIFCAFSIVARADFTADSEVLYTGALLQYHRHSYEEALRLAGEALRGSPGDPKIMELKALILQAKGDREEAFAIYSALIETERAAGKTDESVAPFLFECGMLRFQQDKAKEARGFLERTLAAGFNRGAAHYFLGLIDYREESWNSARAHFLKVVESDAESLKPAARFYLGEIAAQRGEVDDTARFFYAANQPAAETSPTPADRLPAAANDAEELSQGVARLAGHALEGLQRGGWEATVGLGTGYDSNVPQIPLVAAGGPSSQGTAEEILLLGLRYVSSPLHPVQVVSGYRGSFNYCFNPNLKTYQFFLNELSVYLNAFPLARTSYGVKLATDGAFQYSQDTGGKAKYAPYNLGGSVGPYIQHELAPKLVLGGEGFFEPQKFYTDPQVDPSFRLSGNGGTARVFLRRILQDGLWNPQASLVGSLWNTNGQEYQGRAAAIELRNGFYLSPKSWLTLRGSAGVAVYDHRQSFPPRTDQITSAGLGFTQVISRFVIEADLDYTNNFSSDPNYLYRRVVGGVSGSVLF